MGNQSKLTAAVFLPLILLVVVTCTAFADDKCDVVDAVAMGTSTQMGNLGHVKFHFCKYSTPEDRQALVAAFQKGKNQGLTSALEKMPSSGRISPPSTVGYTLAYVRLIPTPTGRRIRFVTNRLMAFGELYHSTRSTWYTLTAGEIDINDQDKTKSTGVLYPAARLKMEKGELIWDLYQNPWKLQNIIDWGNKGNAEGPD
jgi:hypothetical protein